MTTSTVTPADVSFGDHFGKDDGVYTSGWQSFVADLSFFKGQTLQVTFTMSDAGSLVNYYSATLLDGITLIHTPAVK